MSISYLCVSCGSSFIRYNALQRKCGKCAYNLTAKKPIKRIGPVTRKWIDFRNKYIAMNPPDSAGYYNCAICGKPVHIDDVELDHVKSRSRRPDLRFNVNNIQFACHSCNSAKGSK